MKKLLTVIFLVAWGGLLPAQEGVILRDIQTSHQHPEVAGFHYDIFDICGLQPGTVSSRLRVAPPEQFLMGAQTATFVVEYNGFTPQAQAAFQYAVDIWSSILVSDVPIRVKANWAPLDQGVLGAAGPNDFLRNFGGGLQNTWYPVALAEAIQGTALNHPDSADIVATFSSVFNNWYLATDRNPPANQFDFVSVVLHELGHGLGFLGSMSYENGTGSWGFNTNSPFVYDIFAINGSSQQLINTNIFVNPSTALGSQLVSNNLFTAGPKTIDANGGSAAQIYAPNPWEQGSSYAHFDEASYNGTPNALMTPQIAPGEAIHSPGPLMLALFEDNGWQISGGGGGVVVTKSEQIFNGASLPAGWQIVNVDGGPQTWQLVTQVTDNGGNVLVTPQQGSHFLFSSFNSANGKFISDWLITPQLQNIANGDKISIYVGAVGGQFPDSLGVVVSTTDANPGSFSTTLAYFEAPTGISPAPNFTQFEFDISAFAGQNIYVAFVYFHEDGGSAGNASNAIWIDHFEWTGFAPAAISDDSPVAINDFALLQNYPNPFNPETHIRYTLPKATDVELSVFNILGQKVAVLVNQQQAPGAYEVTFDASRLTSGVYFYQLNAGEFSQVRKMLLTR